MRMALEEARLAGEAGEVPVGAVVVYTPRPGIVWPEILGKGRNMTEAGRDVTAHAEILALTAAANHLGAKYLPGCTLYVTLEPCLMCAGALAWAQIGEIVYGASDPRRGYTGFDHGDRPLLHPRTRVRSGVLADESLELVKSFFKARRK